MKHQIHIMQSLKIFILTSFWLPTSFASASTQPAARPATPDSALLQRPFDARDEHLFRQPPRIFYPETWFHFVNGNVSRAGITRDLEAIARSGITGVQLFHGRIGNNTDWPGTQEHIECLSPKWESLVIHTAREAHRLGLRFSLQTCPGWATSGGPWIQPEQAMRHLDFSRVDLAAGMLCDTIIGVPTTKDWEDWRDIAVLAFPTPEGDTTEPMRVESVSADDEKMQEAWQQFFAEGKAFSLPPTSADRPHRVTVKLQSDVMARSLVFNGIDAFNHAFSVQPDMHLTVWAEYGHKQNIKILDTDFPRANWQDSRFNTTFALDPVPTSPCYTLEFVNEHPMRFSRLQFLTAARGHNWEAEGAWSLRSLLRQPDWAQGNPRYEANHYVRRCDICDISDKMDANGRLHWEVPIELSDGRSVAGWTVLRIGHKNTGRRNGPAPEEATGWEVNKLDTAFVGFQFRSYIGRLANGPLKGLVDNMLMDSWECNTQTWTRYMETEFSKRHGYALRPWLPALFGFVLDDRNQTSEFLCDWRRTINDLFVNNFYGYMSQLARRVGMTVSFETAAGDIFPADPLEYYKHADVPMTEFWQPFSHYLGNHNFKPIRPTASAARMYGKPRVTAEAFTSFDLNWDERFAMLRDVAAQNMVEGVSHMVFHTYTHNPGADTYAPGSSFGGSIGTPFLRRQTWWYAMPRFTSFLARCSYLLERGKPVNAVLWYLGDEIEQKPDQFHPFPDGYSYDYCNTDALLHRISIKDGKWTTPDGVQYDVLWVPQRGRLLPETVERLHDLVLEGGVLVAEPPTAPATAARSDREAWRFQYACSHLWNKGLEGKVFSQCSLSDALQQLGIEPDVKPCGVRWTHRRTADADWYMICPQQEQRFEGDVSFRQKGRVEVWNPVSGSVTPIPANADGEYSRVHIQLEVGECLFVMFRHDGKQQPAYEWQQTAQTVPGVWTLSFPTGWGIDAPLQLDKLCAWKDLPLSPEGKAFSGTATYESIMRLNNKQKGCRYVLSLGEVSQLAVVEINGHVCDTLWAAPYETDVTKFVKKGDNWLRLQVTSTWRNRLIYDAGQPEEKRRTWVISGPRADSELRAYGLLGPVVLRQEERK